LLERFQKHDPIWPEEIEVVYNHLAKNLHPLTDAMRLHSPKILAGSSGTFDTLSDIYCLQSGTPLKDFPETPFDISAFEKIFHEIASKDREGRMQIPGMIEMRVEMIVVACCLIKFILTRFTFERIRVSSYSLKEGVLASLIGKA
ncbi:MAG TPA: hypothetical protein VKQ08_12170, partial [Cyclobacteriaceae bacterium]|nr:hypothetical protein [Cyclobacteriaceae bacterium]